MKMKFYSAVLLAAPFLYLACSESKAFAGEQLPETTTRSPSDEKPGASTMATGDKPDQPAGVSKTQKLTVRISADNKSIGINGKRYGGGECVMLTIKQRNSIQSIILIHDKEKPLSKRRGEIQSQLVSIWALCKIPVSVSPEDYLYSHIFVSLRYEENTAEVLGVNYDQKALIKFLKTHQKKIQSLTVDYHDKRGAPQTGQIRDAVTSFGRTHKIPVDVTSPSSTFLPRK